MKVISYKQPMEEQGVDRVSDLPVGILHNIFSFLSMEVAAKTSILSKKWQHVWDSYPVFEFCTSSVLDENRGISIERYADMVDHRLQKFCKLNFSIQKFYFKIPRGVAHEFDYLFKKWMGLILKKQVKELFFYVSYNREIDYSLPQSVFTSRSLTVLKIWSIKLELNIGRSSICLSSLRTLCLYSVSTSDKTIQHLISSCPSLEDLELTDCRGLKELNLFGMVKLHTIKLNEIEGLKLSNYQGLKRVYLVCMKLEDIFDDFNLPQIEFISLSRCTISRDIKISSPQLKIFVLEDQNMDNLEIVAPNLCLVKLDYRYYINKLLLEDLGHATTFISKLNAQYNLNVDLCVDGKSLGTPWFIRFKEILRLQTTTKTLTIYTMFEEDFQTNTFDKEEASFYCSPPCTLEHLILMAEDPSERINQIDFAAIFDGFLWCCHPKTVTIDFEFGDQYLKFLCKTLEELRDDQLCCSSSMIKCWHHALKKVKNVLVQTPKGIEVKVPLCREALLEAFQNVGKETTDRYIRFNLSW